VTVYYADKTGQDRTGQETGQDGMTAPGRGLNPSFEPSICCAMFCLLHTGQVVKWGEASGEPKGKEVFVGIRI